MTALYHGALVHLEPLKKSYSLSENHDNNTVGVSLA